MRETKRPLRRPGVAGFALLLAMTGGEICPVNAGDKLPAQTVVPATLQEAEKVIDLRKFPMLEHGEIFYRTPAKIGYVIAKPDLAADVAFYRAKLTDAGWKMESESVKPELTFGTISATKQGFSLDVNIVKDPNSARMHAFLENEGNVDVRTLPRFAGAKPESSTFDVANYVTDAKPEAVAEYLVGELTKLGWRKVTSYGGLTGSEPGVHEYRMFVQRGMFLNVLIDRDGEATKIMVHAHLMKYAPPILPQATGIELVEEPFLHLGYATKTPASQVLAFYRKELPALGWTVSDKEEKGQEGAIKVILTGPQKEPMRLEVLGQEGITIVLIAGERM